MAIRLTFGLGLLLGIAWPGLPLRQAVERCLATFLLDEFASYYELALRTAAALGDAGYGPA